MILRHFFIASLMLAALPTFGMWKFPQGQNLPRVSKQELEKGHRVRNRLLAEYECRSQQVNPPPARQTHPIAERRLAIAVGHIHALYLPKPNPQMMPGQPVRLGTQTPLQHSLQKKSAL